ncbi:transglutaminase domain-containing protein [Allopusillimonas ginsengisoli]|nr:transglutaminase domain-containing protein [Allopusillimonas ginsengisoli]
MVIKEPNPNVLRQEETINLSVYESSPTYPGFEFENSLDDDLDKDYSAGKEGVAQYVVLKLNKITSVGSLNFNWESEDNFANEIVVRKVEADGSLSGNLVQGEPVHQGDESNVRLSDMAKDVELLRIDFSEFHGQPRVLLRRIEATSGISQDVSRDASFGSMSFAGPKDESNPLSIFRLPITMKLKSQSDRLALTAKSDHERVMRFMDYISKFRIGVARDSSPDAVLDEQVGACGTFTSTLLALAAAQNIPGRSISLLNYPHADGHAVAELFVQGKWRLYDPSYNTFYIDKNDAGGLPLSFNEIRTLYKTSPEQVEIVSNMYRPGMELFTGRNIFVLSQPAGVIGPDHPMVFPLSLDVNKLPMLDETMFGPEYQGASFIGAASTNQNQHWLLSGLVPGKRYRFEVMPAFLGGDLESDDVVFVLSAEVSLRSGEKSLNHTFDFSRKPIEGWPIEFTADDSTAIIDLSHSYRGPGFRYMQMSKYEVKAVK